MKSGHSQGNLQGCIKLKSAASRKLFEKKSHSMLKRASVDEIKIKGLLLGGVEGSFEDLGLT